MLQNVLAKRVTGRSHRAREGAHGGVGTWGAPRGNPLLLLPPSLHLPEHSQSHNLWENLCLFKGLHRRCDDRTTTNLPFFSTGTKTWSGGETTGTYFKKNELLETTTKKQKTKENTGVGILWPKHWCQNNRTFFVFVASVQSIVKNRSLSACESLNTSVCIFLLAPSFSSLSSAKDQQMEKVNIQ